MKTNLQSKQIAAKKLSLHKDTLRRLSSQELSQVAGASGAFTDCCRPGGTNASVCSCSGIV